MSDITVATKNQFNETIAHPDTPALVMFSASWCAPCQGVSKVLEVIQEDYMDDLNVIKVDIDLEPELTSEFGIRSIPTLLTFKEGEVDTRHVGPVNRTDIGMVLAHLCHR